jgi:isocitrate dehydrogenase (NAD+)
MSKTHQVTLLPGGWIGPEACDVVVDVVAAAGVSVDWHRFDVVDELPAEVIADARQTGLVLKGRMGAPQSRGQLPPTVALRKALGTWATVRRARAIPGAPARFPQLDLLIVRETSEDIYAGLEHEITDGVYEAVKVTTAAACERIARFAYAQARAQGRKKVTIVHKSNIMKKSDGLFLKTCQKVGAEHPDIQTDEVIVDALCMKLVRWPASFDVLLTGNLFGDIVSDLCSGLAGGLIAGASASIGDGAAIFENPHGKAPELVGTGKANPLPQLVAAVRLLRHIGEEPAANRIFDAMAGTLTAGVRTPDMGGSASTAEVRAELLQRLG